MKKYFNVSFQYSDGVFCANIAHAESAEAVEKHYSEKYEWCKVSEATAADVEEAQRKGKPIVEIETPKKTKAAQKKHESKTAWSTAHAWAVADELFPGDYAKDEKSSERAGYPIYRATTEGSRAYICDLGDGLEINYDDGSSQRIYIDRDALKTEIQQAEQAEALAREIEQRKAAEEAARKAEEARAADVEEAQRRGKPIVEIEPAPKMPILTINQQEREALEKFGEWSTAMARECMSRNGINFDDIEDINNHYENHRWGSDADRRYRKSAVTKAVAKVAARPADYIRRTA